MPTPPIANTRFAECRTVRHGIDGRSVGDGHGNEESVNTQPARSSLGRAVGQGPGSRAPRNLGVSAQIVRKQTEHCHIAERLTYTGCIGSGALVASPQCRRCSSPAVAACRCQTVTRSSPPNARSITGSSVASASEHEKRSTPVGCPRGRAATQTTTLPAATKSNVVGPQPSAKRRRRGDIASPPALRFIDSTRSRTAAASGRRRALRSDREGACRRSRSRAP